MDSQNGQAKQGSAACMNVLHTRMHLYVYTLLVRTHVRTCMHTCTQVDINMALLGQFLSMETKGTISSETNLSALGTTMQEKKQQKLNEFNKYNNF